MAENCNLGQACSSKNPRHILRSKREDAYFTEEKEKLGQPDVNKESTGGNWECKAWWLFTGWVATISHWLGCCQARRKPSFLLLGFQSSNLPLGDERQVSFCLGSAERKKQEDERASFWHPDSILNEISSFQFYSSKPVRKYMEAVQSSEYGTTWNFWVRLTNHIIWYAYLFQGLYCFKGVICVIYSKTLQHRSCDIYIHLCEVTGFPGGSVVKNLLTSAGDVGDTGSIAPGVGNGTPLQ